MVSASEGPFDRHLSTVVRIKLNNGYENTWSRAKPTVVSNLEWDRQARKSQLKSYDDSATFGTLLSLSSVVMGMTNNFKHSHADSVRSMQTITHPTRLRGAWQPTPVFLPGEPPWTEEPSGLRSMGWQRLGHSWATKNRSLLVIYFKYSRLYVSIPKTSVCFNTKEFFNVTLVFHKKDLKCVFSHWCRNCPIFVVLCPGQRSQAAQLQTNVWSSKVVKSQKKLRDLGTWSQSEEAVGGEWRGSGAAVKVNNMAKT